MSHSTYHTVAPIAVFNLPLTCQSTLVEVVFDHFTNLFPVPGVYSK